MSSVWRECVCGAWYWGAEQTESDKAHSRAAHPSDDLTGAAHRLSDAITDRAIAGRSNLDTTIDVDAEYLAAVKALRAALARLESGEGET